jgi:hypothetical protein
LGIVAGRGLVRARKTVWPLSVSPFAEESLFFVTERGSVPRSWLRSNTKNTRFWIKFRMTELVVGLGTRVWGLANRNGSAIQGFTATDEVIPTSAFGSPSLSHPKLVSGSGSKNEPRRKNNDRFSLNSLPRYVNHRRNHVTT